ncbi:MAG TPA: lantibiotic dehydratase [Streptosporangiaceae bacterium]|nr:lantibiotic dehydratase [Streptosporangiaceae bacterium]
MTGAAGAAPRWQLLDTFLLRRAGFPFDLLQGMAAPRSARTAREYLRATAGAETARRALLGDIFPAEVAIARMAGDRPALRALSRLRRGVGHRHAAQATGLACSPRLAEGLAEWRSAAARGEQLAARLAGQWPAERAAAARHLRALASDQRVSEAIFLLSPSFAAAMRRQPRDEDGHGDGGHGDGGQDAAGGAGPDSAARAYDRRLYAFVQRLAAKNETTSFFGPVTYGSFGTVREPQWGPLSPDGYTSRHGRVAFWAAVALARAATRSPQVRARAPARLLAAVMVTDGTAWLPGMEPVPLSPLQAAVLKSLGEPGGGGDVTAAGIAAALGAAPAMVEHALRELETKALVSRRLEPSSTTVDPLGETTRRLAQLPGAAREEAAGVRLAELAAQWAQARLPEREHVQHEAEQLFEDVTGRPAARGAGRTYADRSIMFEDCVGDGQPVVLPDSWRQRLALCLAPVLDLGLALGAAVRTAHRELAAEIVTQHGDSLPFLAFAEAMRAAVRDGALGPRLAAARAIRGRYARLVLAARATAGATAPCVTLAPSSIRHIAGAVGQAAFASPDILLSDDGSGAVILGEVHPYVFAWGLQGAYHPDPGELSREMGAVAHVWGGSSQLATVLHRRRHKGLLTREFPGTFIEVTGVAGAGTRTVPVSALTVRQGPDGPCLLGPAGDLRLYVGEDDHPHLRVFAPAQVELPRLRLGPVTPRICVGDVVVQRRRWDPGRGALAELVTAGAHQLAIAVAALRERYGIPRFTFVHSPAETKPFLADLSSPFGAEHLQRLARLGPVSLTEMLPGPGGLWLRREGREYTSELRLSMVRSCG